MTNPRASSRKAIFDTVRAIAGRGLTQSEVDHIERAIEGAADTAGPKSSECTAHAPITSQQPQTIGRRGIALIKQFEGCSRRRPDGLIEAYPDPGTGGDPWTIGWGATGKDTSKDGRIGPGTVWTQEQCDARFNDDLIRYADEVSRAIGSAKTSQNQFDAMVSFHYNTGAIGRATLTRKHRAGDHAGAAREFARWNRAGGRIMRGLVRRRAAEAALYNDE